MADPWALGLITMVSADFIDAHGSWGILVQQSEKVLILNHDDKNSDYCLGIGGNCLVTIVTISGHLFREYDFKRRSCFLGDFIVCFTDIFRFFPLIPWKRVAQENVQMLMRVVTNDFCIPDFQRFASVIEELYHVCQENEGGKLASYIPQLERVDPSLWGVAVCTVDGQR